MHKSLSNLSQPLRWLVGSGHQISLNHPDWFHTPNHILREHNLLRGTMADLIHPNTKSWNWDLLGRLYDHNTCVEISKIPIAKIDKSSRYTNMELH